MRGKLLAKMFSIWLLLVVVLLPTIGSFAVQLSLYIALAYGLGKKFLGGESE